jgi:ATP-dependent DNA helicase RecG
VSAFANTEGGHLVFGIKKDGSEFEIVGVLNVDKVQNDFITTLRQKKKISQIIDVQEHLHTIDKNDLLIFYVPEVSRDKKPVYLNGAITRSFLRKGACDVRCSPEEIHRLLRDASNEPYDSDALSDFSSDTFYDEGSVGWYRNIFNKKQPGRHETLSDHDFLLEWGFLKET